MTGATALRSAELSSAPRGAFRRRGARNVRALLAPAAWAALSLLASCGAGGDESELELSLTLDPSPPHVGTAQLSIAIADAEGRPVTGAAVKVEGNMNHAGMVPVFADAAEVEPGRYGAQLEFTMGGDWFLLVDATTPDGETHRWREDVRGVKTE